VVRTRRRRGGIITEAFFIMGLPIRFATEVTNDFISDTISFIDPRWGKKKRKSVGA